MKLVRMLKIMAGPEGVRHPGMKPLAVSDQEAAELVAAEAAEVVGGIDAGGRTVATVDLVVEKAVAPQQGNTQRKTKKQVTNGNG